MAALERITDPVARARAMTLVLDQQRHLAELRGEVVVELLARPGASLRTVGADLELHWTTVRSIRDSHLRKQIREGD
ncbi:hypothetical protein AB0D27_11365 [Streptomyces sp. NPDC048415]|uniref:hypothetical protein n=1 Tax=Streptomyces sp. NPDC048415 TaxID=3154822 RepID=UPI00343F8E06